MTEKIAEQAVERRIRFERDEHRLVVREIPATALKVGMVLADELRTKAGLLLLGRKQKISELLRRCILNFAEEDNIAEPVKIFAPFDPETNHSVNDPASRRTVVNRMDHASCPLCGHTYQFRRFQDYYCAQCGAELSNDPNKPRLYLLNGESVGAMFVLTRGRHNSIGRDHRNAIVLNDEEVSRKHATIICQKDGYWIKDHDSRNGVYVDGKKVKQGRLHHKSEIKLGTTVLKFQVSTSN